MRAAVRRLGLEDREWICRQRSEMYREAGRPVEEIEAAREPFRRWLERKLADGTYVGFGAEAEGRLIAGAGLIVIDWPPHPLHPYESRRGYLLNVFVEPAFRGQGLAKMVVLAIEAEARSMGIGYMTLHASDAGRPVYERLGWVATDEMGLRMDVERS